MLTEVLCRPGFLIVKSSSFHILGDVYVSQSVVEMSGQFVHLNTIDTNTCILTYAYIYEMNDIKTSTDDLRQRLF